jgi:ATP-dependent Lon protease
LQELGGDKGQIEKDIKLLGQKLILSEDQLRANLMEIKPYVDAINGAFSSRKIEIPVVSVSISDIGNAPKLLDKQLNVVNALYANFCKNDRPISKIDIINLIVSTQQSFICFLAGLPGVGKTSLSRIFVQSQGLEKRFKEVSVARGWTSQKDLIGFF